MQRRELSAAQLHDRVGGAWDIHKDAEDGYKKTG